jgi:allophanate hydrolase
VPAGLTADGRPAALMLLGPALADDRVLAVAAALSGQSVPAPAPTPAPTLPTEVTLAVVGHHLSGQPRCADLVDRGGRLLASTTTAERYRLLRTGGATPVPVLVTAPEGGAPIEVELWGLPPAALPEILARSTPSVCLGRVELADRHTEIGFVADTSALDDEDLADITAFGGWRAYLAAR